MFPYGSLFYRRILSAIFCVRICVKIFKNIPSKICGRQPLKNLKWYGLPKQTISLQVF